jgi:pullulanase
MRSWHFNHIDFSTFPHCGDSDLGVFWSKEKMKAKIWAPTAKMVEMRIYNDGNTDSLLNKIQLNPSENGVWQSETDGDFENRYYTIRVNDGEWLHEVPDIYCRCVGVNGQRGMFFDPIKTNPDNWEIDKGPRFNSPVDAIIYEIHIRDFSISENSGIKNKGKYLGCTEMETTTDEGESTGLSHLKELGITHVHLLPVNDFVTVDEQFPDSKYNWGYDPMHYNAPEGSYSSNPFDGVVRIKELKQMIQAFHAEGIGVIIDVVYNHTYYSRESVFNQTVPGYFYRQKPDGSFANASGCGNEIASERSMVRNYIVNSLKYWITEYHIDGFRFDLMGIFDLETMRIIREELNRLDSGIIIYGEGWIADVSPMPEMYRAVKRNISQLEGIAVFNDDFRDALKGDFGNKRSKGFISGLTLREEAVKFGIVAAVWHPQIIYNYVETSNYPWAKQPDQCINYISCHDNYTLWDKLLFSLPRASDEELRQRIKLAGAIILTSQGIPFLHGGIEFCRTKYGNGNSYKSPDSVNQFDWSQKKTYYDVFEYYKKIIRLRKHHPAFRMTNSDDIARNIVFSAEYQFGVVAYFLDGAKAGDTWKRIYIVFNANTITVKVTLPEGRFRIIARGDEFSDNGIGLIAEKSVDVDAISMMLLVDSESFD